MLSTTSSELFINMDPGSIPHWDPKKNYFEQSREVIQFWDEELKKITHGIKINGYFMHPWMYYHLNFFKTRLPQDDKTKKIMCPPLDDNLCYIIESYQEAESRNMGLTMFGTRGFTKSTFLASNIQWINTVKPFGSSMLLGLNDEDLLGITTNIEVGLTNAHPALRLTTIKKDWSSYVSFGYKERNSVDIIHSEVSIRNINPAAGERSSEKGAGMNPVFFGIDEIGKGEFLDSLDSAIPSFITPYGYMLVPILSGTSGNTVLSKDAKKLLSNPETYRMLPMNWDRLDRSVPEEYITWGESKSKPFCTYVPGQMSYRVEVPKLETNLGAYLGLKGSDLKKIKLNQTDWPAATKWITDEENKKDTDKAKNKHKMYYPTKTEHCFLEDSANPFPVHLIGPRIQYLKETGASGKPVKIFRDGSKFKYEQSNKPLAGREYQAIPVEAPILLFGELPKDVPQRYAYSGGVDDYKMDAANYSKSLGSLYILKRKNLAFNQPCHVITASYTARPQRHSSLHSEMEVLSDAFNANVLLEAIDCGYQKYLSLKKKDAKILAPYKSFHVNASKKSSPLLYGVYPTPQNKSIRNAKTIEYTLAEFVMGADESGNPIIRTGVDFIDDIELLEEMADFKPGVGNYDRIDAFGWALCEADYLEEHNIKPREEANYDENYFEEEKPTTTGFYTFDNSVRKRY